MMVAIAELAVFFAFAFLMYRRWMPALLAVPAMAVVMLLVAGAPAAIGDAVVGGAVKLAPVYVTVIFGALLARVTLDTGIARTLVNLAAEYGGEAPLSLALVLCAIVALLFTSLSGLGAIIMVGSIVLPIMMTTGVPRTIAATMFLMAFALGFIFNIVNWTFYTKLFGVSEPQLSKYALVLAAIDAIALIAYAVIAFRRERAYATWAVRAQEERVKAVRWYALVTPILPIVLYFALHVDPMVAFIASAVYGVLTTKPRETITVLVAASIRGVEDVAPAILLFIGIGMLLSATQAPELRAAFAPLVGSWASNPLAFITVFGLLSPLALYRGPLNPFGVGIAVFTVLLASHALPPVMLVAAIMAVVQVQNVCDPTNTANVWVANFTGVGIDAITKRTLPFQVAVATAAAIVVVAGADALFGIHPFASVVPAAQAATLSGLYADAGAARHVAVDSDASSFALAARDETVRVLRARGLQAFPLHTDPNASGCAGKPYAAYVFVSAASFTLVEGDDLDVGLRLEDCGGWIVDEWHEHDAQPRATDLFARALAQHADERLLQWMSGPRGAALIARGLAALPSDPPSYYYSMFKTVDGNMRLYVRAGGPAYDAGLRTNDVVDRLDGKYWWEYGTFQTQARAYDGKPHAFDVHRGDDALSFTLGAL